MAIASITDKLDYKKGQRFNRLFKKNIRQHFDREIQTTKMYKKRQKRQKASKTA